MPTVSEMVGQNFEALDILKQKARLDDAFEHLKYKVSSN
jgi:hypothetical protein